MNERIRELVKQAEQYAIDKANEGSDEDFDYSFDDDFREKFAELIIQECMNALWTEAHFMSDLAVEDYQANCKRIKQHFGVE